MDRVILAVALDGPAEATTDGRVYMPGRPRVIGMRDFAPGDAAWAVLDDLEDLADQAPDATVAFEAPRSVIRRLTGMAAPATIMFQQPERMVDDAPIHPNLF